MCKTIKQKVKFGAPTDVIYRLLVDSKHHSGFSGTKATISRKVGGSFSAGNGQITGINVDLVPGKRLVQAWRTKQFAAGIFSMAAFTLVPTADGGTLLTLVHRGVPKELIPNTEKAWRENYWAKMKQYLSRSI